MPQVPYRGAPEISPHFIETAETRVPAALEQAAGVNIGRARETLGKAYESFGGQVGAFAETQYRLGASFGKVGQLMAESALDFQKIKNETEAKDLFYEGLTGIGDANQQLHSKNGTDFVNAVPGYQTQLQGIRENIIKKASNPEVRRMVDQQIHRFIGFKLEDAGTRAGTEALKANQESTKNALETWLNNSSFDTVSDTEVRSALQTTSSLTRQVCEGMRNGSIGPDCERAIENAQSEWMLRTIKNTQDPEKAEQALNRFGHHMSRTDYEHARKYVREQQGSAMATDDAQRTFDGEPILEGQKRLPAYRPDMTPAEKQPYLDRLDEIARKKGYSFGMYNEYSKNVISKGKQIMKLMDEAYENKIATNVEKLQNYIEGGESKGDPQKRVMNVDAIRGDFAPPEIDAIFKSLPRDEQKKALDSVTKGSRNIVPTPNQQKVYEDTLAWMAEHPRTAATTIIGHLDLPQYMIDDLRQKQRDWHKHVETSPFYNHMVRDLQAMGQQLHINIDDTNEKSTWMNLRGLFEARMSDFARKEGRYPGEIVGDPRKGEDERRQFFRDLTRDLVTKPDRWFLRTEKPYEVDVPQADREEIKRNLERLGIPPDKQTEGMIRDRYIRSRGFKAE